MLLKGRRVLQGLEKALGEQGELRVPAVWQQCGWLPCHSCFPRIRESLVKILECRAHVWEGIWHPGEKKQCPEVIGTQPLSPADLVWGEEKIWDFSL